MSASPERAAREGYALVLNAVITSAVGLGFWIFAARTFGPDEVGAGTALVGVIVLLSSIVSINCGHALQRVLPVAFHRRARLVLGAYGLSAGAACIGALVVWGLGLLPEDVRIFDRWTLLAVLAGGAALSSVFQVQDAAFVGLRSARWIPVENTLYGVVKLGVLVALMSWRGDKAIVVATIGCIPPAAVGMNWLLFRRLIRRRFGSENDEAPMLGRRALSRFIAGDSVAVLSYLLASLLLPTIIAANRGAAESAFFGIPWMIYTTQRLVSNQMAAPVLVEAAINPAELWRTLRRILRHSLALTVLGSVGVLLVAPLGLRVFGSDYSRESTTTMRILAIAAVPHAISTFGWSVQRIRGATRLLVTSSVAIGGLGLVFVAVLLPRYGITGAALGWMFAEVIGAAMVVPETLRAMQAPTGPDLGRPMRVMHLVTTRHAPDLALRAVQASVARGDRVQVLGVRVDAGPFAAVEYESVPSLERIRSHPIAGVRTVARFVGRYRPDVVHTYAVAPAVAARLASVLRHHALVVMTNEHLDDGAERRTARFLRLCGTPVLTASLRDAQRLHVAGLPRDQVFVVPAPAAVPAHANGHARPSAAVPGRRTRVFSVGFLDDVEGWTTFVDALAELGDAEGVVVADGPFRAELERYAARTGVPVRFVQYSEDAVALLRDSDLLVATSPSGVTATLVRSAASMRVPSVLTGPCTSADIAGQPGVFLSPSTAPAAIAATARRALAAPQSHDVAPVIGQVESDAARAVHHYVSVLLGDAG